MSTSHHVPEWSVDTREGRPLVPQDGIAQLEELLNLRSWLARLQRQLFQQAQTLDEVQTARRKEYMKLTATLVSIVDEMRRMADWARPLTEASPQPPPPAPRRSWLSWFRPQPVGSPDEQLVEAMRAMQRSVAAATTRLEAVSVLHVELEGKDLRDLMFEEQPLKAWVSVKNKPRDDALRVKEVIQGLWIGKLENQWVPVQRGEVIVE